MRRHDTARHARAPAASLDSCQRCHRGGRPKLVEVKNLGATQRLTLECWCERHCRWQRVVAAGTPLGGFRL
jgi:hypothetical protein